MSTTSHGGLTRRHLTEGFTSLPDMKRAQDEAYTTNIHRNVENAREELLVRDRNLTSEWRARSTSSVETRQKIALADMAAVSRDAYDTLEIEVASVYDAMGVALQALQIERSKSKTLQAEAAQLHQLLQERSQECFGLSVSLRQTEERLRRKEAENSTLWEAHQLLQEEIADLQCVKQRVEDDQAMMVSQQQELMQTCSTHLDALDREVLQAQNAYELDIATKEDEAMQWQMEYGSLLSQDEGLQTELRNMQDTVKHLRDDHVTLEYERAVALTSLEDLKTSTAGQWQEAIEVIVDLHELLMALRVHNEHATHTISEESIMRMRKKIEKQRSTMLALKDAQSTRIDDLVADVTSLREAHALNLRKHASVVVRSQRMQEELARLRKQLASNSQEGTPAGESKQRPAR